MTMSAQPLSIPSPSSGVWYVGSFPLRAYALCIIAGIVVAMIIASRRWRARGGTADGLESVIVLAVPFGIIGARIYHVITDYELYFGPGRHPVDALKIWRGGLGIWGAVALGALGAYLMARRRKICFPAFLDAVAPALLVAQAIGRLGNWFNQELFGRPTTLPWALEIDPQYRPSGFAQYATFHPTFLYELVWNLLVAAVLVVVDRRYKLGHGKVFALYVLLYTAGRFWIEALRIDSVNEIGGFRLNNYTSLIGFLAAAVWLIWLHRNRPGRETHVEGERPVADEVQPEVADAAVGPAEVEAVGAGAAKSGAAESEAAESGPVSGDPADGESADGKSSDADSVSIGPAKNGPGESKRAGAHPQSLTPDGDDPDL